MDHEGDQALPSSTKLATWQEGMRVNMVPGLNRLAQSDQARMSRSLNADCCVSTVRIMEIQLSRNRWRRECSIHIRSMLEICPGKKAM